MKSNVNNYSLVFFNGLKMEMKMKRCIVYLTRIALKKASNSSLAYDLSSLLSIHTAPPSLEDYEQIYIVQTSFAE